MNEFYGMENRTNQWYGLACFSYGMAFYDIA